MLLLMLMNSKPSFSSLTCLLIKSIIRLVSRIGFLLIPITLSAELLCMVSILYTRCPPPSSLGHRYNASKVLILSILFVVPPLTAYTNAPAGYEGSTKFLPVTICLGDITGCIPPFLLTELIILTVDTTNSIISWFLWCCRQVIQSRVVVVLFRLLVLLLLICWCCRLR